VALLQQAPAGITPAWLPTAGLLDQLKAAHRLDDRTVTAVGTAPCARTNKAGGPHSLFFDGVRRSILQHALNLETAWLLSMNPQPAMAGPALATRAARTSWVGDQRPGRVDHRRRRCRATDKSYRLDTPGARHFLDDFVTLP
jgi:hypothetical protein